jgi:predicted dienelactone hydrolase
MTSWVCIPVLAAALLAQSSGPVIHLPAPTGPHAVGTRTWYWVDPSRPDGLTPAPDDARGMMVQLWYPRGKVVADTTAGAAGGTAPYMPIYGWYGNVRTQSVADAPFAELGHAAPLVVICPERGTSRHAYTTIAQELASWGYAVAGIDSPHSGMVVYPDGTYFEPDEKYKPSDEMMVGPYERVDAFFVEAATLGAQDVAFVLRQLEQLNLTDGLLRGRLDLGNIGVFGHSLGGRIGGAAAAADPRIRAYASMEGVPPRELRRAGMSAAVAMLVGGEFPESHMENVREVIPRRRNDVLIVRLRGLGHNSMTDEPLLEPEKAASTSDPREALALSSRLLRAFFDRYLGGERGALTWLDEMGAIEVEWHQKPATARLQPPEVMVVPMLADCSNHPLLKPWLMPDRPGEFVVVMHDGGPQTTDRRSEVLPVRLLGCEEGIFNAQLLERPDRLTTVKQGDQVQFITPANGSYPLRVTPAYLKERREWAIRPCHLCALPELYDPPSVLQKTLLPDLKEKGPYVFNVRCGACEGVQMVRHRTPVRKELTKLPPADAVRRILSEQTKVAAGKIDMTRPVRELGVTEVMLAQVLWALADGLDRDISDADVMEATGLSRATPDDVTGEVLERIVTSAAPAPAWPRF